MDTDTPKISRRLILFLSLLIFSAAAYAQTCQPVGGVCPTIPGVTCSFPATVEKGCNCYDGKDNDGNGLIDSADPTCAAYLTSYVGAGSTCTLPPPAISDSAALVGVQNQLSTTQNTSDTPAHLVVGMMNQSIGDFTPIGITSSKWGAQVTAVDLIGGTNSAINCTSNSINWPSVVINGTATKTSGSGFLFEHENTIADIDGDKLVEVFNIASFRGGSPNNAPQYYCLTGFKYHPDPAGNGAVKNGSFTPLFDPVPITPYAANRPGSPGVADFNGDGKAEIYIRNQIYAAENGKLLADGGGDWKTAINTSSVAVDIDGDGQLELVCGNFIYKIPSLSTRTPASPQTLTPWKDMNVDFPGTKFYPKGYNDILEYSITQASSTSVADFDEDGFIDVFISGALNCSGNEASACNNSTTTIFYWNVHNNTLQTYSPPDAGGNPLGWTKGAGRINLYDAYPNHGKLEALFISGKTLFCLDMASFTSTPVKPLWTRDLVNDPLSGIESLTCFDFDNNGTVEVIYRDTQQLVVVDGATGTHTWFATMCQAYTMTEGPIVAGVPVTTASGTSVQTAICVPCYFSKSGTSFDISHNSVQEQSHGVFGIFNTKSTPWIPTRKVWNQSPYYVTNINDDLTVPAKQISQDLILGTGACPNGVQGPQRPLNLFMDQVPHLSASGCPEYPAPNVTFYGDTPNPTCVGSPLPAGCDTNGDGSYTPAVVVTPPICGNLGISVKFNITNNGDLNISDNIPISFFNGDPTANPVVATKLFSATMGVVNLGIGQTYTSPPFVFNGPGTTFDLYIAIYNNGLVLPMTFTSVGKNQCTITDKLYKVTISPTPFTVTTEVLQNNLNCPPYAAATNNGHVRSHIYLSGTPLPNPLPAEPAYANYGFQWYDASQNPIAGATNYDLGNLDQGTYYVKVTDKIKGCSSALVPVTVIRSQPPFPNFTVKNIHDQDICSPANGELLVSADDGSTGYIYTWLSYPGLGAIGVSGADAKNLLSGNYVVQITRGACTNPVSPPPAFVKGPSPPDAQASTLLNVVDCLNANSGSVTANAVISGAVVSPSNYTFNWYFYNNTTSTRGSILPGANSTAQTPTGLAAGWYQVEITDNTTKCKATTSPITQVTTSTVLPTAAITRLAKQTSCDPNKPNGILTAVGTATGYTSPTDFKFEWFRGNNTLPANLIPIGGGPEAVSGTKGETLNNVKGGGQIYTVKVTTPLNCSATNTDTVGVAIHYPVITLSQTPNDICDPSKTNPPVLYDGKVSATVVFNGSTVSPTDPNYTYSWYDGSTTTTAHSPTTTTNTITGLQDTKYYTATVTRNDLHCTSNAPSIEVLKASVQPKDSLVSTGSHNCDPALTPDGTVTVYIVKPLPPVVHSYTYQWFDGLTASAPQFNGTAASVPQFTDSPINHNSTTATVINVGGPHNVIGDPNPNKQYTVYVRDITNGCDNLTTQTVSDVSVIPVLATSTTPNAICSPATNFNGSFIVSLTNTTSLTNPPGSNVYPTDFTFTWYNSTTNDPTKLIGTTNPNTGTANTTSDLTAKTITLNKLDVGDYAVIGKNTKTGCTSAVYTNNVIPSKVYPKLAPSFTGSNNCVADGTVVNGVTVKNDGTATATATGTAGPYNYKWYNGTITPTPASTPVISTVQPKLTGLGGPAGAAGTPYTVWVIDQGTGCDAFANITVPDYSTPPLLATATTPNDICDPSIGYAGSMTVTLDPLNKEKVGPSTFPAGYNFAWYDDNTGTTVHAPAVPSSTSGLTKIKDGNYSVIATNNVTGCVSKLAADQVVPTIAFPKLGISSTGSHNCATSFMGSPITPDGTATVTVTPQGADAFTYAWSVDASNPTAPVGTSGAPTNVVSPPSSTISSVGGPNTGSPGTPFNYDIKVTNNRTGCATNGQAQVSDISAKPSLAVQPFDNTICDPTKTSPSVNYNGHVDKTSITNNIAAGYAGTITYLYTWTDVTAPVTAPHLFGTLTNVASSTYTALSSGDYTGVVSIKELGCVSDPTAAVHVNNNFAPPVIVPAVNPNGNCVAFNGTASVTTVDGSPAPGNYTYQWYDGASLNTIRAGETNPALANGGTFQGTQSFSVLVTNKATGCQGNEPVTIVDAHPSISIALTVLNKNTICDTLTFGGSGKLSADVIVNNVSVGAPPPMNYAITWSTHPFHSVLSSNNSVFDQLETKSYSAYVTDTNTGCKSQPDSKSIVDNLTYPAISIVEADQTSCDVANPNGKLDASGTTPAGVTFTWYDGAGTGGSTHTQTSANSGIIDKLPATSTTPFLNYTVQALIAATGCAVTQTQNVVANVAKPGVSLVNSQKVTTCGNSPNGEATTTITGLVGGPAFPSIKYDLFYVYTKKGGTYPTDSTTMVSSVDTNNKSSATSLPGAPSYTGMAPGFLTAFVIDRNTSCSSAINTVQIDDATQIYSITISAKANAGLCNSLTPGGGIDVTVDRAGAACPTCLFTWYKATPINTTLPINFFDNPPNMGGAPALVSPEVNNEDLGGPFPAPFSPGVGAGTYTLVVIDNDLTHKNCGNYLTDFVPTSSQPTIDTTLTHISKCNSPNGQIDVTVNTSGVGSVVGYTIKIFQGTKNDPTKKIAELATPKPAGLASVSTNPNSLPTNPYVDKGDYYVEVVDNDAVNIMCPIGEVVHLKQLVLPPLLNPTTLSANTSCDPLASADGSVQITVTNDSNDKNPAPGKKYRVTALSPQLIPTPYTLPTIVGTGASGQSTTISGLRPISYTVTVTDQTSNCATDLVINVPDQQVAPAVLSAPPTAEQMCAPNSNGSALAQLADLESTSHFSFTWSQTADIVSGPVYTANGNGTNLGELLNKTHATANTPGSYWPLGTTGTISTAASGSGDRIFYLQATKLDYAPGTGIQGVGCKTNIVEVVIPDQHLSPDMSLMTAFDSFCQATVGNNNIGDGKITVTPDADPGTAGQQLSATTFNYNWSPVPNLAAPDPTVTPQNVNTPTYVIGQLHDGTFQVSVTNNFNSCNVVKTAVIAPAPYVLTVDLTDPIIDQRICNNDGWVQVSQVTLKDNSIGSPNSSTDTESSPGNLNALYKFNWYNNVSVTLGTELKDGLGGAGSQIVTRTFSNDVNQDLITNLAGDYQAMAAGTYYVIAERKDPTKIGFGCPTLPFRVDVKDVHQNPQPSLAISSNTSCNNATPGEGEIKITVTDATVAPFNGGNYTYTWSGALVPTGTNVNPGTGNGNGSGTGNGALTGSDADNDDYIELLDGTYNLTTKNNKTGCSVVNTPTVLKNSVPVFVQNVNILPQILCAADGSLQVTAVTVNDPANNNLATPAPLADFQFTWTRPSLSVSIPNTNPLFDKVVYPNIGGTDTYYVIAKRINNHPGNGCSSAPYQAVIENHQVSPKVTLAPFSNTSCLNSAPEGEIQMKVTDATTYTPVPAGGFKFDYNWTTAPTLPYAGHTLATAANNNGDASAADGDGDDPTGLLNGSYTVIVKNSTTLCFANQSTVIPKNATPVFVQNVDVVDQILCTPDGSLTVTKVTLNDGTGLPQTFDSTNPNGAIENMFTDFQFEWTRVGDANNYTEITNVPTNVANGAVLDNTTYIQSPPAVSGFASTFGAATYTVVARRKAGSPGAQCASAPYTVVLQDKSIKPSVSLTPLANTSCDPNFFEGEIKVNVSDLNPKSVPGMLNYTWTSIPNPPSLATTPAPSTNNNGDGLGAGDPSSPDNDNDHPKGLVDGSYTIQVTNLSTGCASPGQTTIFKNSTPVFTQLVVSAPQMLCKPDGSLKVKEVKIIDRDGLSQSNLNTPPDFSLTDFVFKYDRTTVGNTVYTDVNDATPHLDNVNYPTIGFDTYYVTTTRNSGFPGKNCSSAPYRIDIEDKRVYPTVAFTSLANSSCNIAKPNGSVVAIASEPSGTQTDPYTFAWTLNGTPIASVIPTPPVETDATPKSTITMALDGAYIVTATNTNTGCPFAASYNLLLDQTRSTPNIIDVTTIDPIDCNPTAQAEVTKITIGSNSNSTLIPPGSNNVIDTNSTRPGPILTDFIYSWYQGDPTQPGNPPLFPGVIATTPCIGPNCTTNPPTSGVIAGTYYVFVTDPTTDCQSGPKEVVIKPDNIQYPIVGITQTIKQISCIATVGKAELQASAIETNGTTGSYTFTWYPTLDETGTAIGAPQAPSTINNPNLLQKLVVGNYSVQVQNTVTSCISYALFIVPDDSPLFYPSLSTGTSPQTFCVGTDGDAQVRILLDPAYPLTPYDNTAFTTDLYKGLTPNLSNPPDVQQNIPYIITGSATTITYDVPQLPTGFYTFRVTDLNTGCWSSDSVHIRMLQTKPVVVVVQDNPMKNCDPVIADGQLSATADGGQIQGYTFDWYGGATATGSILQVDNKLIGQKSGQYTVRTINNLTGCFDDKSGNILDATVIPPLPTAVTLHDLTSCILPNGEVTANVGGIILGYSFQWYNGLYTDGSKLPSSVNYKLADYSSLNVGDYTVTATDDVTHCVSPPANTPVVDKRVKPAYHVDSTPSYCADTGRLNGNGSFTVIPDVSESFEYAIWSLQGDTTHVVGQGMYITDLFPGDYHVLVTTVDGCQHSKNAKIETEIKPYNLVSTNGDGQNDAFTIDCISNFTVAGGAPRDNNVKIFNRNGTLVYEADGYNNLTVFFRGVGEKGVYLNDKELPEGTYFYIIDKRNGEKPKSGFIELVR